MTKVEQQEDLYAVFGVARDASAGSIKKAYHKLCLKYHPDKISILSSDKERQEASITFQRITHYHAILSDPDRRQRYDKTGFIGKVGGSDDDNGLSFEAPPQGWTAFFRELWSGLITADTISAFALQYRGSNDETTDILDAYHKYNGSMDAVLESVPLCSVDDETRFREIVARTRDEGRLQAVHEVFFVVDEKATERRRRRAEREREEFERDQKKREKKAAAAAAKKKEKGESGEGGNEEDDEEEDDSDWGSQCEDDMETYRPDGIDDEDDDEDDDDDENEFADMLVDDEDEEEAAPKPLKKSPPSKTKSPIKQASSSKKKGKAPEDTGMGALEAALLKRHQERMNGLAAKMEAKYVSAPSKSGEGGSSSKRGGAKSKSVLDFDPIGNDDDFKAFQAKLFKEKAGASSTSSSSSATATTSASKKNASKNSKKKAVVEDTVDDRDEGEEEGEKSKKSKRARRS
ncbi:DnaJ-domain-containing protein [Rhizoclosmatium globosum]|uniref:DnaJ-domain-containing protein n=1 Tax=Rhizoclosmatium globosum TaxID=329046 RepID=A0A1Y2BRR4_9FUNG|nr:DnaJ-domain-containing protein [Rhizoclosmatium globosum]|eukprot:ORY37439.1 DnaJ-domain-containing protein [Rhizoclosmatium globosum]